MKKSREKNLRWGLIVGLLLSTAVSLSARVLPIPVVIQEQNQWCWAATTKAILTYYGNTVSQCQIAEFTRTQATWYNFGSTDCCVNPNVGCNYWNYLYGASGSIVDILNHWNVLNTSLGTALDKATIQTLIDDFRPFLIRWGWTYGGGHFVVGHGLENNNLYYMDPWYGEGAKVASYDWVLSSSDHTWTHSLTPNSRPAVLLPGIGLSKTSLSFGAVVGGASSPSQSVVVGNSGGGTLTWTAGSNQSWLSATPAGGTGTGTIVMGVNPSGLSAGTYTGTLSVTATGATNSPQTISVTLRVVAFGASMIPFGSFDTPGDGSSVSSSIAVTGWALDDIGINGVKIYRYPLAGEGSNLIYIGDALFVEGARPDVEQTFSTYPLSSQAGWGYMMLTNSLPNGGNGMFTLSAMATDLDGHQVTLGQKTITCDNLHAVKPFGAIDTPMQGGTASSALYNNFGWALTPMPASIPVDGSTITVYIDGLPMGHPLYNNFRPDIATLFPGYANSNGAVGVLGIDTTVYSNSVHTIAWVVSDSAGQADGIGSRYFSILNTGGNSPFDGKNTEISRMSEIGRDAPAFPESGQFLSAEERKNIQTDSVHPVFVRRGYDFSRLAEAVHPDREGTLKFSISELERVAVYLDPIQAGETQEVLESRRMKLLGGEMGIGKEVTVNPGMAGEIPPRAAPDSAFQPRYAACLVVGSDFRPLPIGATFDAERGVLYWQPGPGFLGEFTFALLRRESGGALIRQLFIIQVGKLLLK